MTPRLFVAADLEAGGSVLLDESQAHYLRHVMRREDGAGVLLFNGRDGEWQGRLELRGRREAAVAVEARRRAQSDAPDVWLCFAPVKRARVDYLVEKATELGVAGLQPVLTRHTAVERVNLERLQAHAVEAAEQSERLTVPEVRPPLALPRLVETWPAGRRLLMCDETGGGPPIAAVLSAVAAEAASTPWAILIGPEGGFEQGELEALRRMKDVTAVGLGPRILRADTAALAALACWQALLGDWREPTPRLRGDYRTSRSVV